MDYSFLAARLSFTFICTCIFFSWQINSAAAVIQLTTASAAVSVGFIFYIKYPFLLRDAYA